MTHKDVIEVLYELFCDRGVPVHIRSDNGSEFTAKGVHDWLGRLSVKPLFNEPGSPWENGFIESFNGKMRDELLADEIFYSLKEAQVLIEMWLQHYNSIRLHSSLDYKTPAPAAVLVLASQNLQAELSQSVVQLLGQVKVWKWRSRIMSNRKKRTKPKCTGIRKDGNPCNSENLNKFGYCPAHQDQAPKTITERFFTWWRDIQLSYRLIGVLFLFIAIGSILLGIIADVFQVTDSFSHLISSTTDSSVRVVDPSALFTTPASENENLIFITKFKDDSEARNLDVQTVLADAIFEVLPDTINSRVFSANDIVINNKSEAISIGNNHNATIIIWGRYVDNLIEFNFTPLVELCESTTCAERRVISSSVDDLAIFISDFASSSVRWLSLFTIGQVLYLQERFDEALAFFDNAIDTIDRIDADSSQIASVYFYRGSIHGRLSNYPQAIDDLTTAIHSSPRFASAYLHRGNVFSDSGKLDDALVDYEKAIELFSDDYYKAMAYSNRGGVYYDQGEIYKAFEDYDRAINLHPGPELAIISFSSLTTLR